MLDTSRVGRRYKFTVIEWPGVEETDLYTLVGRKLRPYEKEEYNGTVYKYYYVPCGSEFLKIVENYDEKKVYGFRIKIADNCLSYSSKHLKPEELPRRVILRAKLKGLEPSTPEYEYE